MQEIEAKAPVLVPQQLAELDRRIDDVQNGLVELLRWDHVYLSLMQGR